MVYSYIHEDDLVLHIAAAGLLIYGVLSERVEFQSCLNKQVRTARILVHGIHRVYSIAASRRAHFTTNNSQNIAIRNASPSNRVRLELNQGTFFPFWRLPETVEVLLHSGDTPDGVCGMKSNFV